VEDSVLGVVAGLAAGMQVVAYAGNHPESVALLEPLGVPIITDMLLIPEIVAAG